MSLSKALQTSLDGVAVKRYLAERTTSRNLIKVVCALAVVCMNQTALAVIEENTFLGGHAGQSITTGFNDSGVGYLALTSTTTGFRNNAFGAFTSYTILLAIIM